MHQAHLRVQGELGQHPGITVEPQRGGSETFPLSLAEVAGQNLEINSHCFPRRCAFPAMYPFTYWDSVGAYSNPVPEDREALGRRRPLLAREDLPLLSSSLR